MAEILVGLTNNKTSFWDPNTKTYLTLAQKTKKITFNEAMPGIEEHLERICHGLFASNPAIVLYEGKIPEAALNHWKAKFNLSGLSIAKNRADRLNAASATKAEIGIQAATQAKILTPTVDETVKADEVVDEAKVEESAEAKETKAKSTKAKAQKTTEK